MTSRTANRPASADELQNGDVMTVEEFHRAYEAHPDDTKFELIEGVVHMASPVTFSHGSADRLIAGLTWLYETQTPGISGANNTTLKLAPRNELQPDSFLLINAECGGQTTLMEDGYIQGAPEFVIEVSNTSRSVDLNAKRIAYERSGVNEYLVFNVRDQRFHWFDLRANSEIFPDPDGVYRIHTFPGLWIDSRAIIDSDSVRAIATLQNGLASAEHKAFVAELDKRRSAGGA